MHIYFIASYLTETSPFLFKILFRPSIKLMICFLDQEKLRITFVVLTNVVRSQANFYLILYLRLNLESSTDRKNMLLSGFRLKRELLQRAGAGNKSLFLYRNLDLSHQFFFRNLCRVIEIQFPARTQSFKPVLSGV